MNMVSLRSFTWADQTRQRMMQPVRGLLGGNTLKARAFRGGAWLGVGSAAEQGSRFIRNMILVRLLAPAAFGTMAIVMSASVMFQVFTEIGVREGLIQNPRGAEKEYVNAAWWMAFGRALLTCSALFFLAPWVAGFYGKPELTALLRVAVAGLLIEGAMSAKAYIAVKQMKFSRWAGIIHGGSVLGVIVTVILSFFIRGVWALVIGMCAESAARCLLSYVVCPFLPSFRLDRGALRELWQFSRGLFGLSLLNYIFTSADIFVLAKLVPATELGYYTMGIGLAQAPAGFVIRVLGQIFMPALSQVQEDRHRINRIVLRVSSLLLLFGMPALVFAFFCGKSLLTVVYGHQYAVAAPLLIIAAAGALLNMANSQITAVFYAAGAPGLHRRCVAVMAISMIVLTYPLSKWLGPIGAQYASLTSISLGYLLQVERVRRFTEMNISDYGKPFLRGAAVSACVAIVCVASQAIHTNPLPTIGFGIMGCLLAYALACVMLMRDRTVVAPGRAT
jgi:O-antigen/teichoic acid export membrane protein